MEEQPKVRAQDRRYHHHGEQRSPSQYKKAVKNEQIHFQHQETQTKKTGNGKINLIDVEGERIQPADHTASAPHATTNNANRHLTNANARQKSSPKVNSCAPPASGWVQTKTMTSDAQPRDVHHCERQETQHNDSESLQNGELNSVCVTNGFSGDPAPDHDGSGSEGGYTTPKRRRGGKNSGKNCETGTREGNRDGPHGGASVESEASSPESSHSGSRNYGNKSAHKVDIHTLPRRTSAPEDARGDPQRKDTDSKTASASGKKAEDWTKATLSSSAKEDSWTLFKPPPVFPVDNSSAKIVPKISYASKVKENLNKPSLTGGESQSPQASDRLFQVPMSAMKTVTSASFNNGPICRDGNGVPSGSTFFACATSSIPAALSLPCGENVASSSDSNCSSSSNPAAAETRKCTLFIPLNPLNMQPVLPSARHTDNPAAPSHQKALGEIFHNQWGLSFINEPNMGAEVGGQQRGEGKAVSLTFQGECTVAADQPRPDPSSPCPEPASVAADLDRRTSTSGGAPVALVPAPGAREDEASLHHSQEKRMDEAKSPAAASCKHPATAAVLVEASLPTLVPGGPTLVPGGPTSVPGGPILVPGGPTSVPGGPTLVPGGPTSVPGGPTLVPGGPTLVPGGPTSVPGGPTSVPGGSKEQTWPRDLDRRCSWGPFDIKAAVSYHTKEMGSILSLQKQDPNRVVLYHESQCASDQ